MVSAIKVIGYAVALFGLALMGEAAGDWNPGAIFDWWLWPRIKAVMGFVVFVLGVWYANREVPK